MKLEPVDGIEGAVLGTPEVYGDNWLPISRKVKEAVC